MKNSINICRCLIVVAMFAGLTACSEDKLSTLTGISIADTTINLDEDWKASVEFTVSPAGATINSVDAIMSNGYPLKVSGLTSLGEDTWSVHLQVNNTDDFGTSKNVLLTAIQVDGALAQAEFTLVDPLAVPEGAFTVHYPYSVSYCDAATHTAMRLPIILTCESESVSENDIAETTILINNVSPSDFSADKFVFGMSSAGEYGLFVNQETVDRIVSDYPQRYYTVNALMVFVTNNNRVASAPINFMFAPPQATHISEDLTFNAADIATDGYEMTLTLDEVSAWRRIGFLEASQAPYTGTVDLSDYGFYSADGTRVDDGDFFSAEPDLTEGSDYVTVSGDVSYIYEPGTYYFIYHVKSDWEYNGKKYERINANLRYEITLK